MRVKERMKERMRMRECMVDTYIGVKVKWSTSTVSSAPRHLTRLPPYRMAWAFGGVAIPPDRLSPHDAKRNVYC
jgi:hypothetical protein